MGVHGLWELLAPVGRRVSVETLAGRRLAVDASIWMVQFIKAMRDEKGEMVRNAHLLGFFRRICKLLFLRTRPVFVFDGATPALKRRTLAARRRHRDAAQAKIRKTAEKLLISYLKARKLEELAEELKKSSQRKEDAKGKKKSVESTSSSADHQKLDELLAASLAAEEEADGAGGASTSATLEDEMEDEEDEEMILPLNGDNIDPAVLASLPPSMQLDLLVQMRERMMAENRQKYQKIKKSPAKFSQLQIQSYLKTVAFRREIDEVQRCASGKGLGGVQTSKIASETNREFIFSSSFTGDKQVLAQQVGSNGKADSSITKKYTPSDSILNAASTSRSATKTPISEVGNNISSEIETYKDDRGRVRVSRLRGLGIRMTRDIQRNLDLMKEFEQENNVGEYSAAMKDGPSVERNDPTADFSLPKNEVIEISFLEDPEGAKDPVDDIFLHLAAGVSSNKDVEISDDTEDIWEDGIADENATVGMERDGKKEKNVVWTGNSSKGDDVDWEDGTSEMLFNSQSEQAKISKGVVEEEVLMQEAIRRSLEESSVRVTGVGKPDNNSQSALPMASKGVVEEEALVQEAMRRSLEESVVRETRVGVCDNKIGNSILEEKENNEEEVDWEEGSCYSPINTTISPPNEQDALMQDAMTSSKDLGREEPSIKMPGSIDAVKPGKNGSSLVFDTDLGPVESKGNGEESPPEEQDVLMQEAVMQSINDLGRENFSTEMSGRTDAVKPGQNSSSLIFNGNTSPVDNRSKGKQGLNEDYAGKNTCNVSDVSANCKPSRTNVKNLQDDTVHSRSDTVSPEFVEHQLANAISNIKGPIGSIDLGSIPERTLHELDSSDLNQFDSSSKDPVASSSTDSSERGVHQFHTFSDSNQSFSGLSDNNNVAKESKGINIVSDMPTGGDADTDTPDEILMDDLDMISESNLQEEISLLRQEQAELGHQRRKLESHAEAVSSEMFAECQELLQMFGLPYIIAPTEAEAQCAFMEMNNLVDGVVTDDSDVFLFGARSVYKNIFDDRKYVETYFMKDIESELGLNREMLIRMAMLLGSDYTEGVSGIGIVNAIEVVHAFPKEDGLKKFREWVESPDPSILENFELSLKKKSSKESKAGELEDVKETFMDKHRNISKNWHLPASFPSQAVVDAYYCPQVDNSKETFSWGKPDLNLLRKLCWERLGWDKQKADELLLPVLKEYSKHETQLRLEAFYTFNERFAKIRSQRIKKAIKGSSGGAFLDSDDPVQEKNEGKGEPSHGRRTRKKANSINQKGKERKRKSAKVLQEKSDSDASVEECTDKDVPQDGSTQEMTELRRSKRQRNHAKYTEDDIEAIVDDHAANQSEATDTAKIAVDNNRRYADNDRIEAVQVEDSEIARNATEAAPKEYLFSGGGFCTEEGEENIDADKDEPFEGVNATGDAPKEYLFSGGGFCTEEGDDNVDQDTTKPNELVNEAQDVPTSPSTGIKEDVIKTAAGGTDQSTSLDSNPDFPIRGSVKWGLTPMPSLKRRKN